MCGETKPSAKIESMIRRECYGNARRMLERWGTPIIRMGSIERKTRLFSCDGKAWLLTRRRAVLVGDYFEYMDRLVVHGQRVQRKGDDR